MFSIQSDELASLPVGTEVSAKYKGAFCEAKVKKVHRQVKCKVTFKQVKPKMKIFQKIRLMCKECHKSMEAEVATAYFRKFQSSSQIYKMADAI